VPSVQGRHCSRTVGRKIYALRRFDNKIYALRRFHCEINALRRFQREIYALRRFHNKIYALRRFQRETYSRQFAVKPPQCVDSAVKPPRCVDFAVYAVPKHFIVFVSPKGSSNCCNHTRRKKPPRATHAPRSSSLSILFPPVCFPRYHSIMLNRAVGGVCVQGRNGGGNFLFLLPRLGGGRGVWSRSSGGYAGGRRRPATQTASNGGEQAARLGFNQIGSSLWGVVFRRRRSTCENRVPFILFRRSLERGARAGRAVCVMALLHTVSGSRSIGCSSTGWSPSVRKGRNKQEASTNKKQVQAKQGAMRSLLLLLVAQQR
jgi:hypothetical protein